MKQILTVVRTSAGSVSRNHHELRLVAVIGGFAVLGLVASGVDCVLPQLADAVLGIAIGGLADRVGMLGSPIGGGLGRGGGGLFRKAGGALGGRVIRGGGGRGGLARRRLTAIFRTIRVPSGFFTSNFFGCPLPNVVTSFFQPAFPKISQNSFYQLPSCC